MKINYVLIDYENVQSADLTLLRGKPFKIKVFLGANQAKIPAALAAALQAFGGDAEYVPLEASGRNAVDFAVAFYLGLLASEEPGASYFIISKDTGYDPLLRHLKSKGILAHRCASVSDIPALKVSLPPVESARLELVVSDLRRRQAARPRTQKTLLGTMDALFRKELSEAELQGLLKSLCKQGIVKIEGSRVAYELPAVTEEQSSTIKLERLG